MGIIAVDGTGGEPVTLGPMRMRFLEDGRNTGHRLAVAEMSLPPGVVGPPQHVHHEHDETFYVISGNPEFTSGAETVSAPPGTLVTAPPGTPHTFANPGDEPAVLLCTFTPDRYVDYFRELRELPLTEDGGLDHAAMARLMRRYATEVVRPG